uniref:Ubiquitin-like domain-containing protein n=1 Tax=Maylandia zebra TaxID=106582 RepID=A0A3P9D3J6_9CICH
MERNHQVIVQEPRGLKVKVNLCRTEEQFKNMTVRQLKEKIWEKFPDFGGEKHLWLIFVDKMLNDDDALLSDYGIQHMSVIHMLMKLPGGGKKIRHCFSYMLDISGKSSERQSESLL